MQLNQDFVDINATLQKQRRIQEVHSVTWILTNFNEQLHENCMLCLFFFYYSALWETYCIGWITHDLHIFTRRCQPWERSTDLTCKGSIHRLYFIFEATIFIIYDWSITQKYLLQFSTDFVFWAKCCGFANIKGNRTKWLLPKNSHIDRWFSAFNSSVSFVLVIEKIAIK